MSSLKVHKHEFFFDFFAKTETLWSHSQGPVTRDIFENCIRFGRDIRLLNIFTYAQPAMKFLPRMLIMNVHVKTVHILPLSEHAQKFVPRMLSVR
jgi:hypothetical protein